MLSVFRLCIIFFIIFDSDCKSLWPWNCRFSSGAVLALNITAANTAFKWNTLFWKTPHIKLLLKNLKNNQSCWLTQVYIKLRGGLSNPTQRDLAKNSSSTSADVAEGPCSLRDGIYVCVHGPDEAPLAPTSQVTEPSWALHSPCSHAHSWRCLNPLMDIFL